MNHIHPILSSNGTSSTLRTTNLEGQFFYILVEKRAEKVDSRTYRLGVSA
jgi:hypothetical protein